MTRQISDLSLQASSQFRVFLQQVHLMVRRTKSQGPQDSNMEFVLLGRCGGTQLGLDLAQELILLLKMKWRHNFC